MDIDWAHMAVTAAIIFVVVYVMNHTGLTEGASKGKRALLTFVALFIPILLLNLFWPYGG